jgi:opacity protein-like surface antigen
MKFKLLAGAALAAVASASVAQAAEGWYGAVDIGYHWPDSISADSSNNAANGAPYRWDFNQDDDWAAFGRLGYQFNSNWRVELELGYRPGDLDSVRGGPSNSIVGLCAPGVTRTAAAPTCGSPSGDLEVWTAMANVIYDFMPDSAISPFLGAGAGVAHGKLQTLGQFSTVTGALTAANPAIQNLSIDDDDTVFAYQAVAGLSWKASDRLNVDLTYRYLGGSDMDFASVGTGALQPGVFSGDYSDQSVTLGLRYSFAAPPPPPPHAASPTSKASVPTVANNFFTLNILRCLTLSLSPALIFQSFAFVLKDRAFKTAPPPAPRPRPRPARRWTRSTSRSASARRVCGVRGARARRCRGCA